MPKPGSWMNAIRFSAMNATVRMPKRRVGFTSEIGMSCNTFGSIGSARARDRVEREVVMLDELRRVALFSSGVAELTRHQAERIVKDFVKSGEVRRQQAST